MFLNRLLTKEEKARIPRSGGMLKIVLVHPDLPDHVFVSDKNIHVMWHDKKEIENMLRAAAGVLFDHVEDKKTRDQRS